MRKQNLKNYDLSEANELYLDGDLQIVTKTDEDRAIDSFDSITEWKKELEGWDD